MRVNKFISLATALLVLAFTAALSLHAHAKAEAKKDGACTVCVAGHQVKSGSRLSLDKADGPVLEFCHIQEVSIRPHVFRSLIEASSRAPPSA